MNTIKIIIQFKSFNLKLLNRFLHKILNKGYLLNIHSKGPVYLPTRKKLFTVLKSPHVNKTARDQFQLITHKSLLVFYYKSSDYSQLKLFLDYIKNLSGGVQVKIKYINNNSWKKLYI